MSRGRNQQTLKTLLGSLGIILFICLYIPATRIWIFSRIDTVVMQAVEEDSSSNLQQKNSQLQAEVASLMYLKRENKRLREALGIEDRVDVKKYVPTHVISRTDSNYLRKSVQIDVGQTDGVAQGQAVIQHGFLIGTVSEVRKEHSTVQLITDPQSRVAVKLNNKKESKGVLKSPFGVELLVDLVPQSESVSEDVRIFTSGIDELPDGIPVGTIGYIGDSQTQYYKLHVQTPIDFQKIRDLFVIIPS